MHFWFSYPYFFFLLFFLKSNVNINSMKKINNNFKINTLIAEHVENKFLNFKFFWKDIERKWCKYIKKFYFDRYFFNTFSWFIFFNFFLQHFIIFNLFIQSWFLFFLLLYLKKIILFFDLVLNYFFLFSFLLDLVLIILIVFFLFLILLWLKILLHDFLRGCLL